MTFFLHHSAKSDVWIGVSKKAGQSYWEYADGTVATGVSITKNDF